MSADIATSNSSSCLRLLFLHVYHSEIAICMILHHCLLVLHLIVHLHPYSSLYYYLVTHPPICSSVPSSASLPHPSPPWFSVCLARHVPDGMGDSSCSGSLSICASLRLSWNLLPVSLLHCAFAAVWWMFDVSFDISFEDAQLMNLLLFAGILKFRNLSGR